MSSSLLKRTAFPSESAIFPSTLIAALMITRGRTGIRWAGRITTLRVPGEVHLFAATWLRRRSHEGPPGPRRGNALSGEGGGRARDPLRWRRGGIPTRPEPRASHPLGDDGMYRLRRRVDPAKRARPVPRTGHRS